MHAFVVDNAHVFETTDAGASWREISGNLSSFAQQLLTVECVAAVARRLLIVGTNAGTYLASSDDFGSWAPLGTALPNALVYDLTYDSGADMLTAGTFGRGAWQLPAATTIIPAACDVGLAGSACSIDRLLASIPCGGNSHMSGRYYVATKRQLDRDARRLATAAGKARRRRRIVRSVGNNLRRLDRRTSTALDQGAIPLGCATSIRQGIAVAESALVAAD
jgi:hypothetical protein